MTILSNVRYYLKSFFLNGKIIVKIILFVIQILESADSESVGGGEGFSSEEENEEDDDECFQLNVSSDGGLSQQKQLERTEESMKSLEQKLEKLNKIVDGIIDKAIHVENLQKRSKVLWKNKLLNEYFASVAIS